MSAIVEQSLDASENERPQLFTGIGRRFCAFRAADTVLTALAFLVLVLWLQGREPPCRSLRFLLLPFGMLLTWGRFRRRTGDWLRAQWQRIEDFAIRRVRLPWLAALVFVSLPALILYLYQDRTVSSGDTATVMPTAARLATAGNVNLARYFPPDRPLPPHLVRHGDAVRARHPISMVQFALPIAVASRLVGGDTDSPRVHRRLEKLTASVIAALSVGLFFLLALHFGPPIPAFLVTFLLATGSVMFSTAAFALWQHGGTIFWMLIILLVEFRGRPRPSQAATLFQGFACGMMLACRHSAVVFVVPFGIWLLLREPRRAVAAALVAAVTYAPWLLLHSRTHEAPLGLAGQQTSSGFWFTDLPTSLAGLLYSPARGLFVYQPWLLLGLAALIPAMRRDAGPLDALRPRGCRAFFGAVIVAQLLLVGFWRGWAGGHCWGPRLLAEIIPLCALFCVRPVAVLWRSAAGKALIIVLALMAFQLHVGCYFFRAYEWNVHVDIDRNEPMVWSWTNPPFLHLQIR